MAWNKKLLETLSKCLCFLSTLAFCCGVSTQECCIMVPNEVYKVGRLNSGALPVLIALIFLENLVRMVLKNWLSMNCTSDLFFIRNVQTNREQSSTMVKKYG